MDDRPIMRRPLSNERVPYAESDTCRRATAREARRALATAALVVAFGSALLLMLIGIAAPMPA